MNHQTPVKSFLTLFLRHVPQYSDAGNTPLQTMTCAVTGFQVSWLSISFRVAAKAAEPLVHVLFPLWCVSTQLRQETLGLTGADHEVPESELLKPVGQLIVDAQVRDRPNSVSNSVLSAYSVILSVVWSDSLYCIVVDH